MNSTQQQIEQISRATAVMRATNEALRDGDEEKLVSLGFSKEHIEQLKMTTNPAFFQQSIKNNNALIRFLKRKLKAKNQEEGAHAN